ncbi:hypothetical protein [Primorskyibacter flagellatus]|uniref:TIR domain-containing protein n=1 Tax=Primorskyibacter flagellatus TaxID=1387277 RepID=A0A1W2EM96_9RHOB|nr:hypothetical protein [Primorskyibacter flagellatus]SMD10804.1 hypothetical protein SAMN06295998_13326 [Primorskyibacter flagellatus]
MPNSPSPRSHCFVITPYGDQNGDEEDQLMFERINNLVKNIIEPVETLLLEDGINWKMLVGRDRAHEDGLWRRIGQQIASAETVIAVVASDKPNTYLELGFAYGLWQRPVLIQLGGYPKPSDLKGMTWLHVSHEEAENPTTKAAKDKTAELARLLKQIALDGGRRPPECLNEKTTSYGLHTTYNRFNAISLGDWSTMIKDAREFVSIVMPKGLKVRTRSFQMNDLEEAQLADLIRLKTLDDHIPFTLLVNHPASISEAYLKSTGDMTVSEFQARLNETFKKWKKLEEEITAQAGKERFKVLRVEGLQLQYRATLTERRLLMTPRFISERFDSHHTIDAPNISGTKDTPSLYAMYRAEIEKMVKIGNNSE